MDRGADCVESASPRQPNLTLDVGIRPVVGKNHVRTSSTIRRVHIRVSYAFPGLGERERKGERRNGNQIENGNGGLSVEAVFVHPLV